MLKLIGVIFLLISIFYLIPGLWFYTDTIQVARNLIYNYGDLVLPIVGIVAGLAILYRIIRFILSLINGGGGSGGCSCGGGCSRCVT
jgi:hypothetical protein